MLWRLCGHKDLTALPGVADYVLLQLLGEVGTDLGKHWKTEKHFTAPMIAPRAVEPVWFPMTPPTAAPVAAPAQ